MGTKPLWGAKTKKDAIKHEARRTSKELANHFSVVRFK
jgi:hypothetical protein